MKILLSFLYVFFMCFSFKAFAVFDLMTNPSLEKGAQVYKARCVLCHGQNGKGEGLIPVSIFNSAKPNLINNEHSQDEISLRNIIIWGGFQNKMNAFSPPWGNELIWGEIESLILFIKYLREQNLQAVKLLQNSVVTSKTDRHVGRLIFNNRCAICHSKTGEGNGRLAKFIITPPPFNLTESVLPDAALKEIIMKGGAAVSRSPAMPSWNSELSPAELDSLILYTKSLRK